MEAFQPLKFTLAHPAGATLFVEGQACRGIYILCKGRVKLSATSRAGHTLIFKIAQPGEVLDSTLGALKQELNNRVELLKAKTLNDRERKPEQWQ